MLKKSKFLIVMIALIMSITSCKMGTGDEEVEEVAGTETTETTKTTETPKFTITYDANGHSTAPESKTVEKGYKLTTEDLPTLNENGFTFGGWRLGEKTVAVGEEITADITLKAEWTEWGRVAKPSFSESAGEVDRGTEIEIACTTDGAVIYYTLDGTTPTASSTRYGAKIVINAATTIKAIAVKNEMKDSEVAEVTYTVDITPPANVTNLTATCTASQTVKLTWTNPTDADFAKVVITYGTDGSVEVLKTATPNDQKTITGLTNGTQYTFTVKAIDEAGNASSGVSVNAKPVVYTITYLSVFGNVPYPKTVSPGYKLTANDLPSLNDEFDNCIFNAWKFEGNNISAGYEINKSITLTADWFGPPGMPVTSISAGVRLADVEGAQDLPSFDVPLPDYLYLSEDAVGLRVGILAMTMDKDRRYQYQWYKGTPETSGKWIVCSSDRAQFFNVEAGTSYYMLEAKSLDGNSIAYSNVCTVVCGGAITENIGKIAYSDGTYNSDYVSGKTPVGIIFDVNADGTPKKIVNLNQSTSQLKCHNDASFSNSENFATSLTDGSNNWNIIKNTPGISDAVGSDGKATDNYPAFKYCESLTDGGKTWYLPAKDELFKLLINKTVVNEAIGRLMTNSVTAKKVTVTDDVEPYYWSSSCSDICDSMWRCRGSESGAYMDTYTPCFLFDVRAVAAF